MIRKANTSDVVDVVSMWTAMQDEISMVGRCADTDQKERFYKSLVAKLDRNDYHILVAEEAGRVVGFIMGKVHYFEYGVSDLVGYCDHAYVYPNHRKSGVLTELKDQLIAWGKGLGAKSYEFMTVYDLKLVEVLEKQGYRPVQIIYRKEM